MTWRPHGLAAPEDGLEDLLAVAVSLAALDAELTDDELAALGHDAPRRTTYFN